ncbi:hypothetical protein AC578_9953 [Pseudocercospora eumusae]|uniref:Uncharacterized protein n=1 Tax=Pseudocercospora eumusae TaxID=321146 RepID=A0A139H099_9PEZI|nr:hypothetical protein AC578_9953 [Pseudocercospora eumusae]
MTPKTLFERLNAAGQSLLPISYSKLKMLRYDILRVCLAVLELLHTRAKLDMAFSEVDSVLRTKLDLTTQALLDALSTFCRTSFLFVELTLLDGFLLSLLALFAHDPHLDLTA